MHGDTKVQVSDRSILPGPVAPQLVTTWRPKLEQEIISPATRAILDPIVVRPGVVFGGASTILSNWLSSLVEAKKNGNNATVIAKKDALIPTVHKNDLAEAYRLIVEKVCYIPSSFKSSIPTHLTNTPQSSLLSNISTRYST